MERRFFLRGTAAIVAAGISGRMSQSALLLENRSSMSISGDPRRPQYHLLPSHNWMNDPNGPIYFNGKYHMFFQYNPEAAVWGNMSWNHAISEDMLHWRNYPVAFTMTPGGPDAAGCFSGSTVIAEKDGRQRVYAIYTGVVRDKDHETIRNEGLRESQCIAWSDDPLLRRWTKQARPVIAAPPKGLNIVGFRDPSVWKQGGQYYMILGAGIEKVGGCALLYRSTNLFDWEYLHPLATGTWNGKATSNPVDDGEMWECPEIFELDGQHLLIYSTERKVIWQSGVLDPQSMIFQQKKSGIIDMGAFYAPKSQLDANGRRILWGWVPERRSQDEMLKAGWSGIMSLPRVLHLDADGSLKIEFLPSTKALRRSAIKAEVYRDKATVRVPGCTGEVVLSAPRGEDWQMRVELPGKTLELTYDAGAHAFVAKDTKVELQSGDLPSVHMFFDGSVLEVLLAHRIGMIERFYYEGKTAPDVAVEITGKKLQVQAWNLASISTNRLT